MLHNHVVDNRKLTFIPILVRHFGVQCTSCLVYISVNNGLVRNGADGQVEKPSSMES